MLSHVKNVHMSHNHHGCKKNKLVEVNNQPAICKKDIEHALEQAIHYELKNASVKKIPSSQQADSQKRNEEVIQEAVKSIHEVSELIEKS